MYKIGDRFLIKGVRNPDLIYTFKNVPFTATVRERWNVIDLW